MYALVPQHHKALRAQAQPVPLEAIASSDIQNLIAGMKKVLHNEKFGVAIAAPQVGASWQMFIVSGHVLTKRVRESADTDTPDDLVCINPVITKKSKKRTIGDEGCLSVPGKYGTKVERAEKVHLTYFNERGERCERGASGFLARVFQHEVDHLNGTLYIDHALEVIDVDENLKPLSS